MASWTIEREALASQYFGALGAPAILKQTFRSHDLIAVKDFFRHGATPGTKPAVLLHLAIAAGSTKIFAFLLKKYGADAMYEQLGGQFYWQYENGDKDDDDGGDDDTNDDDTVDNGEDAAATADSTNNNNDGDDDDNSEAKGPDVGGNALHVAVALSRLDIMKLILAKAKGHVREKAHDWEDWEGPIFMVQSRYITHPVASKESNEWKCTPLALALANDDLEATKILIAAGALSTGHAGGRLTGSAEQDVSNDLMHQVFKHGAQQCRDHLLASLTNAELRPSPTLLQLATGDADDLAFCLGRFPDVLITPDTLQRALFSPVAREALRLLCSSLERTRSNHILNVPVQVLGVLGVPGALCWGAFCGNVCPAHALRACDH